MMPVFLTYFALFNAAFSRVASQLIWSRQLHFQEHPFVFFELSATKPALKTQVHLERCRTIGTLLALVIAYLTRAKPSPASRARLPSPGPDRNPSSCSGRRFLSSRAPLRATTDALDPADRLRDVELPAAYKQLQSAFRSVTPTSRTRAASSRHTAAALRQITRRSAHSVIATWCSSSSGSCGELRPRYAVTWRRGGSFCLDLKESGTLPSSRCRAHPADHDLRRGALVNASGLRCRRLRNA